MFYLHIDLYIAVWSGVYSLQKVFIKQYSLNIIYQRCKPRHKSRQSLFYYVRVQNTNFRRKSFNTVEIHKTVRYETTIPERVNSQPLFRGSTYRESSLNFKTKHVLHFALAQPLKEDVNTFGFMGYKLKYSGLKVEILLFCLNIICQLLYTKLWYN